ncbi:hypothetical protein DFH28DRAFT_932778 [Melampsora americana]|nr:hypothetical protein DFH28DRAFT_932778 [Melampsora americana]
MSWLYPITHNIPWFIRTPAIALLGPECYTHLIYDLKLDHLICLKLGISRALSLAILIGSAIVKIPQIFKILKSKSVRGLSLISFILDTLGLIIIVGYNYRHEFPISTYGESFLLFIQNLIITSLIISLSRQSQSTLLSILSLILPIATLTILLIPTSPVPLSVLQALLTLTIPLSLSSKLPQILINHQKKSTGQLSSFLIFSSFLGCLARLFTTLTETGDLTLLFNFGAGTLLNGILTIQMISYWKESTTSDYHSLDSNDQMFELSHSTSISSSSTSALRRPNPNPSPSSQPTINLNKPKQWTRKAD